MLEALKNTLPWRHFLSVWACNFQRRVTSRGPFLLRYYLLPVPVDLLRAVCFMTRRLDCNKSSDSSLWSADLLSADLVSLQAPHWETRETGRHYCGAESSARRGGGSGSHRGAGGTHDCRWPEATQQAQNHVCQVGALQPVALLLHNFFLYSRYRELCSFGL